MPAPLASDREAELAKLANTHSVALQARQQADDTIAALQAAEKETHNQPPPMHWYSNPAALNQVSGARNEPSQGRSDH